MPTDPAALFEYARQALGVTQLELGVRLGVSRRTAQRWSHQGIPSHELPALARLVHPHDPELAGRIAAAGKTTLEALRLVTPKPAPPVPASSPLPPLPPPPPPDAVVDAVVCAAADAMQSTPTMVRAGLLAAFARAREVGVSVEMAERVLRAKLFPPPEPVAQVAAGAKSQNKAPTRRR